MEDCGALAEAMVVSGRSRNKMARSAARTMKTTGNFLMIGLMGENRITFEGLTICLVG